MLNIYSAISTEGLSFGSCGTSFPEKAFLRSDISQVFEVDDIFILWLAISEIIRVKTPFASP